VNQLFDLLYNKADVDGLFTDFPDKAVSFCRINAEIAGWRLPYPAYRRL
jgi:hypothetical protein